ncbi:CLUMA_CG006743, isoform A [Clunio marinus]|uniref:CLUMA_CG006743, isoform A n=1 Tax=Clunio marinus TaxID=568069 RepID=A0A1J1HYM5_9DIPT|nr:CLUMA_CG006743, isoform A [Clunio marinus]
MEIFYVLRDLLQGFKDLRRKKSKAAHKIHVELLFVFRKMEVAVNISVSFGKLIAKIADKFYNIFYCEFIKHFDVQRNVQQTEAISYFFTLHTIVEHEIHQELKR